MTTVNPPPRNLNTMELVGWWKVADPSKREFDIHTLAGRIRLARINGHLERVNGGHDAYHTPEAVMAWFAGGCKYLKGRE
jgi:hypothetical protein